MMMRRMERPPSSQPPDVDLSLLQRPFLAVVQLSLLAGGAVLLARAPQPPSAGRLAALCVLSLSFAALQWSLPRVPARRLPFLGAIALLGALGLLIAVSARSFAPALALSLSTLGLAVGALGRRSDSAAVAAALIAGVLGLGVWLEGAPALPRLASTAVPTVLLVTFYVEMYQRQARSRVDAQKALAELGEAHRALAASAAQVKELTVHAERERMARELHDTLAQTLAGLSLQLEALDAHLGRGDSAKAQAILKQARERAKAALAEARSAIDDLRRAPAPAELSLALREQIQRFTSATGIGCKLELSPDLAVPPALAAHALRVVGEGLSNCARHAGARQIELRVRCEDEELRIELADDGRGFDAQAAPLAGHYGLVGMRERARLAGGSLAIASAPGRGTTLRFTAPIREIA